MRTTRSTQIALERFADVLGWTLERDGRQFALHIPGGEEDGPPIAKNSARTLALGVSCVRFTEEWPIIQEAVAYDPGWVQMRDGTRLYMVPRLPKNLVAWEEWELQCLCEPYHPDREAP